MKFLTPFALIIMMMVVSAFSIPAEPDTNTTNLENSNQEWFVVCHYPGHQGDRSRSIHSQKAALSVAKNYNDTDYCNLRFGRVGGHAIALADDGDANGHFPHNKKKKKKKKHHKG